MKIDKQASYRFKKANKISLVGRSIKIILIGISIVIITCFSNNIRHQSNKNVIIVPPTSYQEITTNQNTDNELPKQEELVDYTETNSDKQDLRLLETNYNEKTITNENITVEQPLNIETIVNENSDVSSQVLPIYNNTENSTPFQTIDKQKKVVALSYDDGPAKTLTLELLSILQDNNSTATFFILGNKVSKYSDIILQLHSAGNEIGNHSYNHSDFAKLTKEQIIKQFEMTEEAIYQVTNEYPTFFRPPYGSLTNQMKSYISSPIILWSIDSNDWRPISDEQVINNILSELDEGKIILMHDIHKRTIEISRTIIPMIKDLGYEIVSIKQLFEHYNIEPQDGQVYSRVKKIK